MTPRELIRLRLFNQQITATQFKKPAEIVSWMVAMQAQEYAHAKWAIGLRLNGVGDATVERAFNEGKILRTHLMRPTWHFVTPRDIRWMIALTAPRVNAANAYMYRKLELDDRTFRRGNTVLAAMLEGRRWLTRAQLAAGLEKVKIRASGLRLAYLLMRAELDGLICSGPRVGKQFTYALLDERASPSASRRFDRNRALAELTARYFASRGPATLRDCAYWSGLTIRDVKAGANLLPREFERQTSDGNEYVLPPIGSASVRRERFQSTFLLPDYDEYGMSYKDRSALKNPARVSTSANKGYDHSLVIDGTIGGTWQRSAKTNTVEATVEVPLNRSRQAVAKALERYKAFLNG